MASSVITSIQSAVDDLNLLKSIFPGLGVNEFEILMHKLRSLRTFLLCARNLAEDVLLSSEDNNNNEDASLGSLLARIQDVVSRNADEIHSCCLDLEDEVVFHVETKITNFPLEIELFEKEIGEWYIVLSDNSRQSRSPVANEVLNIFDSILENLEDFLSFHTAYVGFLVVPIEALVEKIKFLRSFICFATLQNTVENRQFRDCLTHIEALAINAARLTVHLFSASHYNPEVFSAFGAHTRSQLSYDDMRFMISELLKKMEPSDPQSYDAYTQALTSLKCSRQLYAPTMKIDEDPIIIMRDFIVFLLSNLWEILQMESSVVVSIKDQLQVLYEGLRFLRTILNVPTNNLDEGMRDFTLVAICEAGVVIFSLYQKDIEIDLWLVDLLEKFKVIRAEVEVKVPEASAFNWPKTDVLGFLNYLLENLMEVKSCDVDSVTQSHVQRIKEEVLSLRSFLEEIEEMQNEREVQALWNCAVEVAYRIEFLIDQLVLGDIQYSLSTSLESITVDIRNIKADAFKIFHGKRQEIEAKKVTRSSSDVPPQTISQTTDDFVDFHNEATSIMDRLTRGSRKLQIVAIVGMPGLGKTTLATKVFNHPSVILRFNVRAQCTISQVFNRKKVLLKLLNHINSDSSEEYLKMTEDDLANKLRRCLKGRRYLIFLDDVWDIEVLDSFRGTFPDDSTESRIILTSRHHNVAKLDENPHFPRQLTRDESWELLQKKVFPGKCWPSAVYELGMMIAEKCRGLPLTIVLVAGLLSTTEQEGWKDVLESLSSDIISTTEQCLSTLELSYQHLPEYLKPCLLCFGAFPEDQEFSVDRLIWLWLAEGFVRKSGSKSSEDVATDYLMNLIGRSLVMVSRRRSTGDVKACRAHDLLHDFCLRKAKEEQFFQLLKGYQELSTFNEPGNLRRLCIYSRPHDFKESKLFCPRVRSLLFFNQEAWNHQRLDISFVFRIFKLLKVLDIEQINFGFHFPSEIGLLTTLKYLAIQGAPKVPPSIGSLLNLETFIVRSSGDTDVSLPDTFWNLKKLRHVYLSEAGAETFGGFVLSEKNLETSSNLHELDSITPLSSDSWGSIEMLLRKFPNIRKLKCRLYEFGDDSEKRLAPSFLSRLETLQVSFFKNFNQFEFGLPKTIKKLTLSGCGLPWSKISTIGKLPNLEVLKLLHGSFFGQTWYVEEGEFSNLRFLKLDSLHIVHWSIASDDDQFPKLEKLVLERCKRLETIPSSCFEYIPNIQMIEVLNCPECIGRFVEQIRDTQKEMGNSTIEILVRSLEEYTF